MKIGIFGGTFNPLHNGHFEVIKHLKDDLKIVDKIVVVPNGDPTHKSDDLIDRFDRYVMVADSMEELDMFNNGYSISSYEVTKSTPSETFELLEYMKFLYSDDDLFFILGSDSFFTIHEWQNYKKFTSMVGLIIMERETEWDKSKYTEYIEDKLGSNFDLMHIGDDVNWYWYNNSEKGINRIVISKVPHMEISSTMIRQRIKDGKSIEKLVPGPVSNFIL